MRFVFLAVLFLSSNLFAQNPNVFVTDSKSWEISGGFGGSSSGFGGATSGGARPQTAEIIKTFNERCPQVSVNLKQEKADYIILLDKEGGKGWVRKDNKIAVFTLEGDSIFSESTRSLGNAVKEACGAILQNWDSVGRVRSAARAEAAPATSPASPAASAAPASTPASASAAGMASVEIASEPSGADIEVDGSFVGSTPSTVELPLGEHSIVISKSGHKRWERRVKITGGRINLKAELQPDK